MTTKRMPKQLNCADRLYNEVISYGGIPMRRADVYNLARKAQPEWKPGSGRFGPDYQAFAPEAIEVEPWTIEEYDAFMAEWEARMAQPLELHPRVEAVDQMALPL